MAVGSRLELRRIRLQRRGRVEPDNRIDLIVGGAARAIYVRGLGAGRFDFDSFVEFELPVSAAQGSRYGGPLDAYYDAVRDSFYLRTTASSTVGEEWAILKFSKTGSLAAETGSSNSTKESKSNRPAPRPRT